MHNYDKQTRTKTTQLSRCGRCVQLPTGHHFCLLACHCAIPACRARSASQATRAGSGTRLKHTRPRTALGHPQRCPQCGASLCPHVRVDESAVREVVDSLKAHRASHALVDRLLALHAMHALAHRIPQRDGMPNREANLPKLLVRHLCQLRRRDVRVRELVRVLERRLVSKRLEQLERSRFELRMAALSPITLDEG